MKLIQKGQKTYFDYLCRHYDVIILQFCVVCGIICKLNFSGTMPATKFVHVAYTKLKIMSNIFNGCITYRSGNFCVKFYKNS